MKSQNENKTNLLSVKFKLNNSRPKNILLLNVDMKLFIKRKKVKKRTLLLLLRKSLRKRRRKIIL